MQVWLCKERIVSRNSLSIFNKILNCNFYLKPKVREKNGTLKSGKVCWIWQIINSVSLKKYKWSYWQWQNITQFGRQYQNKSGLHHLAGALSELISQQWQVRSTSTVSSEQFHIGSGHRVISNTEWNINIKKYLWHQLILKKKKIQPELLKFLPLPSMGVISR